MSSDSSLAPPISVRSSDVENGAALTIGSATLHLTRPQTIGLIDELSRALVGTAASCHSFPCSGEPPLTGGCPLEAGSEPPQALFSDRLVQATIVRIDIRFFHPADRRTGIAADSGAQGDR